MSLETIKIKQIIMTNEFVMAYNHQTFVEIEDCYAIALVKVKYRDYATKETDTKVVGMTIVDGELRYVDDCEHSIGLIPRGKLDSYVKAWGKPIKMADNMEERDHCPEPVSRLHKKMFGL